MQRLLVWMLHSYQLTACQTILIGSVCTFVCVNYVKYNNKRRYISTMCICMYLTTLTTVAATWGLSSLEWINVETTRVDRRIYECIVRVYGTCVMRVQNKNTYSINLNKDLITVMVSFPIHIHIYTHTCTIFKCTFMDYALFQLGGLQEGFALYGNYRWLVFDYINRLIDLHVTALTEND